MLFIRGEEMEKKLPKIFANKVDKQFDNNEKVFYSKDDNLTKANDSQRNENNIYQKINEIFSSERYVYKADVEIKTTNEIIKTKIIGHNKTHLITIDDQLIPIENKEDINYIK